jgi:hypothetical protein
VNVCAVVALAQASLPTPLRLAAAQAVASAQLLVLLPPAVLAFQQYWWARWLLLADALALSLCGSDLRRQWAGRSADQPTF